VYLGIGVYRGPPEVYRGPCMKNMRQKTPITYTCCTRLAENTGRKKVAKNRHLCTIAQLCRAISSQLRHVSTTIGKSLLSSNMSSRCPHNIVNFGPLAAEIGLPVWCTPANFNGFRDFPALLHGSQVVSVSQTLRR